MKTIEARNFGTTTVEALENGTYHWGYKRPVYKYAHNPMELYEANANEPFLPIGDMPEFASPAGECSVYKNIPMKYRWNPAIRELMATGMYRIKYRGASKPEHVYTRPQAYTLAEYADTFAIYLK